MVMGEEKPRLRERFKYQIGQLDASRIKSPFFLVLGQTKLGERDRQCHGFVPMPHFKF